MVLACSAVLASALLPGAASAQRTQSNPFMPPSAGVSRDQVQAIIRQEIERSRGGSAGSSTPTRQPGGPGLPPGGGVQSQLRPGAPGVSGLPQQPGGVPSASTASGQPAARAADPVADMLKDGGIFVGCVGGTPVFKDRIGRRAYFTTKELRESNEARRFTRCG